ncbi:MAG: hypothetical protein WCC82_05555, partial [Nitrososphaeraceae archaeon]
YQLLLTLQSVKGIKNKDPLLDKKIEKICTGLQISYVNNLRSISIENNNIVIIINYINSMKTEQFTDKSSSLLLD